MVNPTFVVASVGLALPLLAGAHIVAGDEVFRDRMAAFGPSTPVDGAKGILIAMSSVLPDDSGCSWAETPRPPSRLTFEDETQWFALVERGKCSFVDKVRAMQHMGASLVVVGDNVPHGALVTMYATGDTFDINIPSVFVSQSSYHELRKMALEPPPRGNVTHPPHLQVEVFPEELDVPILEILIVTIISPAAVMTFLYILWSWRQYRAMQAELAPVRSVQKLPRKKWLARECKENDPTICAICLEHFEDNDEVRILPCKHEFHIPCIDRWLTRQKRTCPVCKADTCPPTPTERTPLLRDERRRVAPVGASAAVSTALTTNSDANLEAGGSSSTLLDASTEYGKDRGKGVSFRESKEDEVVLAGSSSSSTSYGSTSEAAPLSVTVQVDEN